MNKKLKYIFSIFLLLISIVKVDALSVSKNEITIEKGNKESIELYANVSESVTNIEFILVHTTNDIPASFIVNSNFVDTNPGGSKHSINFDTPQTGNILLGTISVNPKSDGIDTLGTVSAYNGKATTDLGGIITLNRKDINIKITTPVVVTPPQTEQPKPNVSDTPVDNNKKEEPKKETPKQEQNTNTNNNKNNNNIKENEEKKEEEVIKQETYNLLEKIESEIVKIDIQEDVFEYTVTINKETLELDLKPVAIDTNSKIDITSQKIEELKDNKILITVKNGEEEQIYTINVNMIKDFEKAEIDNGKFEENNSYKGKWLVISIILIVVFIVGLLLTKKK